MNEKDMKDFLNSVVAKNKLVNKAGKACVEYLKNWKEDEPAEYKKYFGAEADDKLKAEFNSASWVFNSIHSEESRIIIKLDVFTDPQERMLWYSFVTDLNGGLINDYLSK
jgi:hypothetical protein